MTVSIVAWTDGTPEALGHMPYWGKVVGAVAGLATGRPWMALIGLILGHQFDRGFADRFSKIGPDISSARLEKLPEPYIRALFQAMGSLAKADGRVSEDEIRAARSLMHRLGLGPRDIRKAILWFDEGKQTDFNLASTIRHLRANGARTAESRGLFVRLLMEVALSKPSLHQRERAAIWTICVEMDVGRVELAQLEAMLRAQRSFRRSPAGDEDSRRVKDAYKVLGVDGTASNDDIKQAYRRLMNRNHPDKLAASDPDDEQIAQAEQKTMKVRSAYEMLKARRSIR